MGPSARTDPHSSLHEPPSVQQGRLLCENDVLPRHAPAEWQQQAARGAISPDPRARAATFTWGGPQVPVAPKTALEGGVPRHILAAQLTAAQPVHMAWTSVLACGAVLSSRGSLNPPPHCDSLGAVRIRDWRQRHLKAALPRQAPPSLPPSQTSVLSAYDHVAPCTEKDREARICGSRQCEMIGLPPLRVTLRRPSSLKACA